MVEQSQKQLRIIYINKQKGDFLCQLHHFKSDKKKIEISNKWVYTQDYNLSYFESFSTGIHKLDLSNYLPDDNYVYEIQGWITFSSSTNTLLRLGNSKSTRRYFTDPVSQNWDTRVFNLEILKDKKLILNIADGQSENTYIDICAYRKLYIDDYT